MTDLTTQPSDPLLDVDTVHVVCCGDWDTSFCGLDMRGQGLTTGDATCVVCADLEKARYCPKLGRCKWVIGP